MKKTHYRNTAAALAMAVFSATTVLVSCQATESAAAETEAAAAKAPGAAEMKSFEIALQNLNSPSNRAAKTASDSEGEKAVKETLLQESKDLIYSTGVTENDLLVRFGNDENKIISLALQIHAENAKGKLKI